MNATLTFAVSALGGCALGLSACAATEGASSDSTSEKPSLHRVTATTGTEPLPTAPTWRQGMPPRPAPFPLLAFPSFQHVPPSYEVQLPEPPVRATSEIIVALRTVRATLKLSPLRPQRVLTSKSIERAPLARR